jgi:hypothetical protein
MKSIILGIPQTLFHPILMFTAAVILATLVFVMLPAHGSGQQGKERAVQIKTIKNQPVDIVAVKVKGAPVEPGQKFAGDSDWFNGMVVTLKNVSDKPIVFATVFVMAPEEKNGVRTQIEGRDIYANIELVYGEPPPMPGGPPRSNRVPPLMPGQTAVVLLDETWRDEFYSRLRGRDSSTDIPELTLSVWQVAFLGDDDTMWMHGFWRRRDPNRPGAWLTVDDPPRLNHAARKPKYLGALKPGSNLGGIYHTLDALPRCTVRDIGDVPAPVIHGRDARATSLLCCRRPHRLAVTVEFFDSPKLGQHFARL